MKNWVKLSPKEEKKITGGFAFASMMAVWGMTLLTASVIRSLFAEKGSLSVNGTGRMSWDDKPDPVSNSNENEGGSQASSLELEKFMSKFYEF